jgi:phospholipid/cholesterol/gamma-HCH transport system substrate-binding protein
VIKQAPSLGRMIGMAVFTLSCFGLLLFLWLTFGGSIPLKPEGYRVKVSFPEAATLAQEADVRLAGVNIGKVKTKELDENDEGDPVARTVVELELDPAYAPVPKNTKAILRQKTLLGETYVELAAGDKSTGMLDDGGTLPNQQVEDTTQLDEIFNAFDEETRDAFKEWVAELSKAIKGGRGQDLNDTFGNLEGFAVDGAKLLETLDEQEIALRRVVKNTGVVFGALNERQGQLRELIQNSNRTFEATASRDAALAETFAIFPTFLDESKATLARLEDFSVDTNPLVNDLKGPADDLGPTVRDLGDLAPDLEALFKDLNPLIRESRRGLPALQRTVAQLEPFFEAAHTFFPELNPILSFLGFHQSTISGFFSNGAYDLSLDIAGQRGQMQIGMIEPRSFEKFDTTQDWERGNAYLMPNALMRALTLGTFESFDCTHDEDSPGSGKRQDPVDVGEHRPPCFEAPPSLWDGKVFPRLQKGVTPKVRAPQGLEGSLSADPNQR